MSSTHLAHHELESVIIIIIITIISISISISIRFFSLFSFFIVTTTIITIIIVRMSCRPQSTACDALWR